MEIHSAISSRSRRKTFTVPHLPQVQGDICNRTFVSSGDGPPPVHGNNLDRPHPILKESMRGNCGGSSSFSFPTAQNGNAPTTVTILPSGRSLEPHSSLRDSFLNSLHNSFLKDADVRKRNEQRNSIFEDLEGTLHMSRDKLQSIGINYSDSEDLQSSVLETSTESEEKFFEVSIVEPRRKHNKSSNTKLDMLRLEERHLKEDLDSVNTQINFLNVQKRAEKKKLNHEIQAMVSGYDDNRRRIEEIKADIQKMVQETQRLEGMRKNVRCNLEIRAEFPKILFKFEDQWACLDKDFCHEFCKEANNRCENVHRGNPAPNL